MKRLGFFHSRDGWRPPRCSAGDCRFAAGHLGRHAMTPHGARLYQAERAMIDSVARAMFAFPADDLGRPVEDA